MGIQDIILLLLLGLLVVLALVSIRRRPEKRRLRRLFRLLRQLCRLFLRFFPQYAGLKNICRKNPAGKEMALSRRDFMLLQNSKNETGGFNPADLGACSC